MHIYIYDKNGNLFPTVDGNNSYASGPQVKKFLYNGVATTLRIAPGTRSMKLYSISAKAIADKDHSLIDKEWNLGDMLTDLENNNVEDLEVLYDDEHDVKFNPNTMVSYDGIEYRGYVNLNGRGTETYRSIKLYSPCNADIYVKARVSGESDFNGRALCLVNKYGYIISKSSVDGNQGLSSNIYTYRFPYIGDEYTGEDLYIISLDSGIHIYNIKVESRIYGNEELDEVLDFSDDEWNNTEGTIFGNTEFNDVFSVMATSIRPVKIINSDMLYNNETYSRCLSLEGRGSNEYRNLKMNVPGNVNIKIYAASSPNNTSDSVELLVFDENGFEITKQTISSAITMLDINYTGGKNILNISSLFGSVYIFKVELSSNTYNSTTIASIVEIENLVSNNIVESSSAIEIDTSLTDEDENFHAQNDEIPKDIYPKELTVNKYYFTSVESYAFADCTKLKFADISRCSN